MTGCKTPQSTKVTDRVKADLPSQYQQDSDRRSQATLTPWKQFFTDPALIALIDTAWPTIRI
jgi:outer membrane protein TolC